MEHTPRKKNTTINWDFEQIDDSTYKATFDMETKGEDMNHVFKMALGRLKRKGIRASGNPDLIESFSLPDELKNLFTLQLRQAMRKPIKNMIEDVRKDGIIIQSTQVEDAIYKHHKSGDWTATIIIKGIMHDKRE